MSSDISYTKRYIDYSSMKSKWEITIDVMMIIGKYFESNNDYINIMKLNKKYHDLVEMYHFNPINDSDLFINIETQYLYDENDTKKEGMYQYVYLYQVDYEMFKKRKENEIFKRVELNNEEIDWETREYPLPIENGKCIIPEGVTSIGNKCFKGCTTLAHISLPSTLINIGSFSFSNTDITTITIPEGVTSIGDKWFYECTTLTNITLLIV